MSQEQIDLIIKVAKAIAPKYKFAHYTAEDLIQEAILMGMDAHKRWDGKRPFENFVSTHISNRLKTFKRDKYFRPNGNKDITKAQECKKNLVQPEPLTFDIKKVEYNNMFNWNELDDIMPAEYRKAYLKLRSGVKISASAKTKIMNILKEYVEKNR